MNIEGFVNNDNNMLVMVNNLYVLLFTQVVNRLKNTSKVKNRFIPGLRRGGKLIFSS